MILKRVVASTLVGIMMLGLTQVAYASNINTSGEDATKQEVMEVEDIVATGIDDLHVQLNDLYKEVGRNLNIDYVYVKILHLLAGGKAIYADQRPNIYAELTAIYAGSAFDIEGAKNEYIIQAPWATIPDETISRPNKYYLPDAAYSTTAEVVKIMNQRYYADRGKMQSYFDALEISVKTNVIFCEAVLEFIGAPINVVNSFYPSYEKMLYEKDKDERVVEADGDGTYTIKDKFKTILTSNNISDERYIEALSLILSFDSKLAESSSPDAVKEEYVLPYKINYTSRENMMLAAMSVVGKVRYVWGGGHLGTGSIDGINPSWQAFFDTYSEGVGHDMCIQPSISWCPIHGFVSADNSCAFMLNNEYSASDYVQSRENIMNTENMQGEKYESLLETGVNFDHGVSSHRLDGLDCSGYTSWVYNQITDKRKYDSGAGSFISAGGLRVVPYGQEMLPGDVYSWGEHIVLIVGKASILSDAYVMIEAAPNMVKFGVVYYGSAKSSDIALAKSIAKEANSLIGNLPEGESTYSYNMDTLGGQIGRLQYPFLDEELVISEYGKTINNMDAMEIIQYTIDNFTKPYISGIDIYTGSIFNTDNITEISDNSVTDIETMARRAIESADETQDNARVEQLVVGDNTDVK